MKTSVTFSVTGARLIDLQYDAGHVHVVGQHAEVEPVRVAGRLRAPHGARPFDLDGVVVLDQRHPHGAVQPVVWKLQ